MTLERGERKGIGTKAQKGDLQKIKMPAFDYDLAGDRRPYWLHILLAWQVPPPPLPPPPLLDACACQDYANFFVVEGDKDADRKKSAGGGSLQYFPLPPSQNFVARARNVELNLGLAAGCMAVASRAFLLPNFFLFLFPPVLHLHLKGFLLLLLLFLPTH